jgi:hypothetical protein
MCVLFDKSRATINEHILNVFKEKELEKEEVVRKIGISDFSQNVTKPTNYYSLEKLLLLLHCDFKVFLDMTELIIKNDIEKKKMDGLLLFLKSWDIDAEIKPAKKIAKDKRIAEFKQALKVFASLVKLGG